MTVTEFYEAVENDPELTGYNLVIAEDFHDDIMVVKDKLEVMIAVKVPLILKLEWKELRALITGEREINPLDLYTRIVGYFSLVSNWNASKIGELKDRKEGAKLGSYSF